MPSAADPLWYKDAVVYQLHVKAFFDANGDGIGDFAGLLQKLDYLHALGVTALWLLPFYPSPLRDDGYDIADYRSIHASYGNMRDFKAFVNAAHDRGIRVITELVINHTSDQNAWFKRARAAKRGSKLRDWYVWSDSDQKYAGTRIIFTDTEPSNWAWDPVAQQYYWHRFFSHQPDLNFDNPQVFRAVVNVMRYWLDMGVDGLRLDAIPYLCEREGTNNENLPETHAVLKRLRAEMDARYPDRIFLAEANQWPEDVSAYFGDADECHMAFHFPLMPRMYMAIAQEDRHPITDIMRQTPELPGNCQWAIFLRNHDELTLEMVTDSERDYLWNTYAADRRARINLGIRRRLAPLMENDRRKIELMNSLLMSMPGTPILYYGDELGMGDNIFLGDRNGVRTPMQWSPDRNGGFSRADPAALYLPPLMDAVYGYQSVNVEAQSNNQSSLLNWMRRLIAIRQGQKAFGRGTLTFLYPANRAIFAYLRQYENETILCVANLSRSPQPFSLDLREFEGRVPLELSGRTRFPAITSAPYELSLQGHSFYWFALHAALAPAEAAPRIDQPPEFVTLVCSEGAQDVFRGRNMQVMLSYALPAYIPRQRWFRAKDRELRGVTMAGAVPLPGNGHTWLMTTLEASFADQEGKQRYIVPMALDWREVRLQPSEVQPLVIAKTRRAAREGTLFDAIGDDRFIATLVDHLRNGSTLEGEGARLQFEPTSAFDQVPQTEQLAITRTGVEQSNTTLIINEAIVLKLIRMLEPGRHPEVEYGRFLTEKAQYRNTPAFYGSIEIAHGSGKPMVLGVVHAFVRNQGDGWSFTLKYLNRVLEESVMVEGQAPSEPATTHAVYLNQVRQLGLRVAELHRALCPEEAHRSRIGQRFAPERADAADLQRWSRQMRDEVKQGIRGLRRVRSRLPEATRQRADELIERRDEILACLKTSIEATGPLKKTRIHGDLHLGQVLVAQNDFYIIDFEGEPRRSLADRLRKECPMRDVAGMMRSFDYAAWAAIGQIAATQPERQKELQAHALAWRNLTIEAFLSSYREAIAGCACYPAEPAAADALLRLFLLGKAFYEIGYELANRPNWLDIPLQGAIELLPPKAGA